MSCIAITHRPIRDVLGVVPTGEADAGLEDALVVLDGIMLQEYVFCAPEATGAEHGNLDIFCRICNPYDEL